LDQAQGTSRHDPRKSIGERYSSREAFLEQVRESAQQLVKSGFLLEQDIDPMVERSAAEWAYLHR
jgi:hypothetical protein